MLRRPPRSTRPTHSFPTRRSSDLPIMLNVRDLYEAELARCRATFDSVNWTSSTVAEKHLRCTECGSDLVEQRDSTNTDQEKLELVCRGCGDRKSTRLNSSH